MVVTGSLSRVVTWVSGHPLVVDGLLAGLAAAVLAVSYAGSSRLVALVLTVEVGGLALRRVRPVASAALVLGAAFLHWLLYVLGPAFDDGSLLASDVAVPIVVYSCAA